MSLRASLTLGLAVAAATVAFVVLWRSEPDTNAATPPPVASETIATEQVAFREESEPEVEATSEGARRAVDAPQQPTAAAVTASGIPVEFRVQGLAGADQALLELWHPAQPDPPVLYSTDSNGVLALTLEPGKIYFSAWTETRSSTRLGDQLLPEDHERVIPIELGPCGFAEGRVVEAIRGYPIEGARLMIEVLHKRQEVRTDSDGWYRISMPLDAMGRGIKCRADGYAEDSAMLRFSTEGWWVERAGPAGSTEGLGVARVDFELFPEGSIGGHVVGPDRSPIAQADVRAEGCYWGSQHAAIPNEGTATTGPDGAFAISGLLPDISHHVSIGFAGLATEHVVVPPSLKPIRDMGTIALTPESILDGMLLDARRAPVEGLEVRLERSPRRGDPLQDAEGPFPRDSGLGGFRAHHSDTAADGSFRLTGLASGPYRLIVMSDKRRIHEVELELALAEQRSEVVALPEQFQDIQGVVLDAVDPVRGARVELDCAGLRTTLSDDQGRFHFRGLGSPTATYRLQAQWDDETGKRRKSAIVEAKAGSPLVRLELATP